MHAIMCSNNDTALVPYGLACKSLTDTTTTVSSPAASASAAAAAAAYVSLAPGGVTLTQAALEHYRLQLYNYAYADRFRFTHPALAAAVSSPFQLTAGYAAGLAHDASPQAFSLSPYSGKFDPRAYRLQEEPKPQHSYIGLIGMAILNSPDKKLVLSDIYQYILDNYAYFRSRGPGWRNSIRHNLSLNDCFIKAGRSANGKGHYWAIHPANIEDFKKGDFRRRKAQRRVRKHMGLAVPDDEDSTSPPPNPPQSIVPPARGKAPSSLWSDMTVKNPVHVPSSTASSSPPTQGMAQRNNKRQFDMESLLAPDPDPKRARLRFQRAVATCAARTDAECCEDETCNQDPSRSASGRGDGDSDSDSDGQSPRLIHHNMNQRVSLQNHHQANGGPCSRTLWSLAQCNSIPGQNAWSVPVPVPVPVSKPFAYALSSAAAGSSCWAALSAAAAAAAAAAANNPSDMAENHVADADERSVAESTSASTTWMGC